MRLLVPTLSAALLVAAAFPALAQSRGMDVEIDRAQRIQLRGAASSVIVANPAVADVTVVDASTLYVTGRGYGSTEVVVVDAIGRTLFQSVVNVTAPAASGHVRMWRGGVATEMSCTTGCAPSQHQAPAPASVAPDGTP
ncbi:pilus assembly protein N-terminal domain-containing protein [Brevundimonas sp.]|uniref:pilus assembly protein N-terminal domain-containing protein n=1 Tax=Brevundimonas sp. TaxID=1871086 RepID=UPI00391DEE64